MIWPVTLCFAFSTSQAIGLGLDVKNIPFVSVWNSPTEVCEHFGIKLNLSYFDIIANSKERFEGNEIVIFYKASLGLYPWIDDDGNYIHSGLPQLADLEAHLVRLSQDVEQMIPSWNFSGLAVIDWEEWRPIFERNGYNEHQKIYIRASESLVRNKHPDWSEKHVQEEARAEFERASKQFLMSSIRKVSELRSLCFWGMYGFPNCYNDVPGQKQCDDKTQVLNNRLDWLFNISAAYFPSIYLREDFGTSLDRYWKVHGTLEETRRLKNMYGGRYVPIVPYTRYRYADSANFYGNEDLRNTIEQVAEVGFNGVVLWENSASLQTPSDCENLRYYLDFSLGPLVRNVSQHAKLCSIEMCSSHGRCFKTTWMDRDPVSFSNLLTVIFRDIILRLVTYILHRTYVSEYARVLSDESEGPCDSRFSTYSCICFAGWTGKFCQIKT